MLHIASAFHFSIITDHEPLQFFKSTVVTYFFSSHKQRVTSYTDLHHKLILLNLLFKLSCMFCLVRYFLLFHFGSVMSRSTSEELLMFFSSWVGWAGVSQHHCIRQESPQPLIVFLSLQNSFIKRKWFVLPIIFPLHFVKINVLMLCKVLINIVSQIFPIATVRKHWLLFIKCERHFFCLYFIYLRMGFLLGNFVFLTVFEQRIKLIFTILSWYSHCSILLVFIFFILMFSILIIYGCLRTMFIIYNVLTLCKIIEMDAFSWCFIHFNIK